MTLHKSGHNTHTRAYGKKTWSVKNLGRKFIITANTVHGASRVLDNMCTHGGGRNPLSPSLPPPPPPPPPRYPQERGRRVVRVGRSSHSSFFPCAKPFCFYLLLLLFLLRRRITHAWLGPSPFPLPSSFSSMASSSSLSSPGKRGGGGGFWRRRRRRGLTHFSFSFSSAVMGARIGGEEKLFLLSAEG